MEQLSVPYRIAIVAIALMGAIWFIALRPGTDSSPSTAAAPGVKGLSNAVSAAHGAVAKADAASALAAGSTPPATAAVPVTPVRAPAAKTPAVAGGASAKARAAKQNLAGPILADLAKGRVAVLAFAGTQAADDLSVRRAMKSVNRHGGKVVVRTVSIADVANYGAITRGVSVAQSPTVLVMGSDRKARSIVGFTDSSEINQLVGDVGGKGF